MVQRLCCVCKRTRNHNRLLGIASVNFPKNHTRSDQWAEAIGNDDVLRMSPPERLRKRVFLCGSHFSKECFIFFKKKDGNACFQKGKYALKKDAVPTLNLHLRHLVIPTASRRLGKINFSVMSDSLSSAGGELAVTHQSVEGKVDKQSKQSVLASHLLNDHNYYTGAREHSTKHSVQYGVESVFSAGKTIPSHSGKFAVTHQGMEGKVDKQSEQSVQASHLATDHDYCTGAVEHSTKHSVQYDVDLVFSAGKTVSSPSGKFAVTCRGMAKKVEKQSDQSSHASHLVTDYHYCTGATDHSTKHSVHLGVESVFYAGKTISSPSGKFGVEKNTVLGTPRVLLSTQDKIVTSPSGKFSVKSICVAKKLQRKRLFDSLGESSHTSNIMTDDHDSSMVENESEHFVETPDLHGRQSKMARQYIQLKEQTSNDNVEASLNAEKKVRKSPYSNREKSLALKLRAERKKNRKLRVQLEELKRETLAAASSQKSGFSVKQSRETLFQALNRLFSGVMLDFLSMQLRNATEAPSRRRFTNKEKALCLTLFLRSPKTYEFWRKFLILPSRAVLQSWCRLMKISAGPSNDLVAVLKRFAEKLGSEEKNIAVIVDEMSIKKFLRFDARKDQVVGYENLGNGKGSSKLATSALVVMIRSLGGSWRLPFAYYFTASNCPATELEDLIKRCLDLLFDIGLKPRVIISDQGQNFRSLVTRLGISEQKPYFSFRGNKIYYYYDPCHLLKSVRNNFASYNIVFEDGTRAEWSHIRRAYHFLTRNNIKMLPRLKKEHVYLSNLRKMNVSAAARVLSHSVSAALYYLHARRILECLPTAKFVRDMDKLFDIFNASSVQDRKKFRRPLSLSGNKSDSEKFAFLDKMSEMFSKLKLVHPLSRKDGTKLVKCFNGWRITIASLKGLCSDLQSDGVKALVTRRLNQDCLENFFGLMRRKGGLNDNPSVYEFENSFKQSLCCFITLPVKTGSNCEYDDSTILEVVSLLQGKTHKQKLDSSDVFDDQVFEDDSFFDDFASLLENEVTNAGSFSSIRVSGHFDQKAEKDCLKYVAGWSLKSFFDHHKCTECVSSLQENGRTSDDEFLKSKAYESTEHLPYDGLTIPTQQCFNFVRECEAVLLEKMKTIGHQPRIRDRIISHLPSCQLFCSDASYLQFVRKFIDMRIHYIVKFTNAEVLECKSEKKKKRKVKILQHK